MASHIGFTRVHLSLELIEPLLGPLSAAERLLCQFIVTETIMHETVHAIWNEIAKSEHQRTEINDQHEPYFEDEVISEVGWSMEQNVFGNCSETFNTNEEIEMGFQQGGLNQYGFNCYVTETEWPILNPKPRNFHEEDIYPVPLAWFADLHDSAIWAYVRKNGSSGGKFAQMGPKTLGWKTIEGPPMRREVIWEDEIPAIDMSQQPTANRQAKYEHERRRRAIRIGRAIRQRVKAQMATKAEQDKIAILTPQEIEDRRQELEDAADEDTDDEDHRQDPNFTFCPRFNEIQTYLIQQRQRLKIDTMQFRMAEHVFYNHIMVNGGIALTSGELRNFLIICHLRKMLFSWEKFGQWPLPTFGVVSRIDPGWPPLGPAPTHAQPNNLTIALTRKAEWLTSMNRMIAGGIFSDLENPFKVYDFDLQELWMLMNVPYVGGTLPGGRFSREEFEACLWSEHTAGGRFGFGPEGIVRKFKGNTPPPSPSSSPSSPPPPVKPRSPPRGPQVPKPKGLRQHRFPRGKRPPKSNKSGRVGKKQKRP